jgi:aromatic ring hydroxylase
MTEEIMPREDRMGKIMTFIGGCLAGIIGVFAVAVMSEINANSEFSTDYSDNFGHECEDDKQDTVG